VRCIFTPAVLILSVCSQLARGEEPKADLPQSKPGCVLFCRWTQGDKHWGFETVSLREGEHRSISTMSPEPWRSGAAEPRKGSPDTKEPARLEMVDQGTRVEVKLVSRHEHGAMIDATIEQTRLAQQDRVADSPDEISAVETHKKRVVENVEFDHTLVIPLGKDRGDEKSPRVEIFLGGGETIRFDWTWRAPQKILDPDDAQRAFVFDKLHAEISCTRTSKYAAMTGRSLFSDLGLGLAAELCSLTTFYPGKFDLSDDEQQEVEPDLFETLLDDALCLPHDGPLMNWLGALDPILNSFQTEIEEKLFGATDAYHILLFDSPTLADDIELLGSVKYLTSVTILTDRTDARLQTAIKKLQARHVSVKPTSLAQYRAVHLITDERHDEAHNENEAAKTVSVAVYQAEAAVKSLKERPNLRHLLIGASRPEDVDKANVARAMLQKALPNAEVHVLLYTGKWPR